MIIVEGPDGAGKSTLISRLGFERRSLKALTGGVGAEMVNGWGEGAPALVAYTRKVMEALKVKEDAQKFVRPIAYDRFHLSEAVYGPILRNKQLLSDADLIMLTEYLRAKHVQVILCMPPLPLTIENVRMEGRERPSYQTEGFLQTAYQRFTTMAPWATVVYDYSRDPLPHILF